MTEAPPVDVVTEAFQLRQVGDYPAAFALIDDALKEESPWRNNPEFWRVVGLLDGDRKEYTKAKAAFLKVLGCTNADGSPRLPMIPEIWAEVALAHIVVGEYGDAREMFDIASTLADEHAIPIDHPRRMDILLSQGGLFGRYGRLRKARRRYEQVCKVRGYPDRPLTDHHRYSIGLAHLLLQHYGDGFRGYESRFAMFDQRASLWFKPPNLSRWEEGQRGSVVVWAEQGAGDLVQMWRYLPMVAASCGQPVTVRCGSELHELVKAVPGVGDVFLRDDPRAEACDYEVPLMSLPLAFGIETAADIPAPVVPDGFGWRDPRNLLRRVGVCWSGNPGHTNDKDRSAPWTTVGALCGQIPGATFVVLQPDVPAVIADVVPGKWERPTLGSYADTARAMQTLDAVVTVDTSVVHLAATLGVPTWLVPPTGPEWRWTLDSESPWYGTNLHIVRRTRCDAWPDAWDEVARQVSRFLQRRAA